MHDHPIQLLDSASSTFTYILPDAAGVEAALIDPVAAHWQRDLAHVERLGLRLSLILETHAHADHVTSAGHLRKLTGARTAVPSGCGIAPAELQLIEGCGRTDFQGGSAADLYDSIMQKLFTLPDATRVWPGHDYKGQSVSTIGWEKHQNARLAGRTRDGFIALMDGLDLPHPKLIDLAVPANRKLGLLS